MDQRLTILIVGWNSAPVLPASLAALEKISAIDAVVHYIDNHSTDNSVALVRQMLPRAQVTVLPRNVGFAQANNIGIAACQTPYILLHNPDVAVNEQEIISMLHRFEDPLVGAVQGKLLRTTRYGTWQIIDSAGIELSLALNGIERGANAIDTNQYSAEKRVLAVTGACGMFRFAALESIAYSATEFLDNGFFSYKEDVDLGWRLNNAGWHVWYLPILAGYHQRTLGRRGIFNWGMNPQQIFRRLRSPRTRFSLRNWVWLIVKNASLAQLLIHAGPILLRASVFILLSIIYPPLLKTWFEVIAGLPTYVRRRLTQPGRVRS